MANNNQTIFQKIGNIFRGNNGNYVPSEIITTPPSQRGTNDRVLFTTNDRAEYERKLKTYQQQKYLLRKIDIFHLYISDYSHIYCRIF